MTSTAPNSAAVWTRVAGRGFGAIADQGLFATSNFILSVMLARWLEPAEYGAFAAIFSLFLLLGTAHTALITEPMLVFGSGRFADRWAAYAGAVMQLHWRLTGAIAGSLMAVGVVGAVATRSSLWFALIGLAAVSPLILALWTARRMSYVRRRPGRAAWAGLAYMGLLLACVFGLERAALLSPLSAFLGMGAVSTLVAASLMVIQRVPPTSTDGHERSVLSEAGTSHLRYGRWALGSLALAWLPTNLFFLLLPALGRIEDAAQLRALMNVVLPALHVHAALAAAALPALTGRSVGQWAGRLRFLGGGLVLIGSIYTILLVAWGDNLMTLLYAGRYVSNDASLAVLAALPITVALGATTAAGLRAIERPDLILVAYVTSAIAVTSGFPLLSLLGLPGVALAIVIASAAVGAHMLLALYRLGVKGAVVVPGV